MWAVKNSNLIIYYISSGLWNFMFTSITYTHQCSGVLLSNTKWQQFMILGQRHKNIVYVESYDSTIVFWN